jgi:hypothetical protein
MPISISWRCMGRTLSPCLLPPLPFFLFENSGSGATDRKAGVVCTPPITPPPPTLHRFCLPTTPHNGRRKKKTRRRIEIEGRNVPFKPGAASLTH